MSEKIGREGERETIKERRLRERKNEKECVCESVTAKARERE